MKIPATFNEVKSENSVMRTLSNLFRSNIREYGMLIALIAVMVFFQFQTGGILFKPVNITNLVLQNSYVITMALGMLLIIVSGWIDLSVGSCPMGFDSCLFPAGRCSDWSFSRLLGCVSKNPGLHCYPGRHVDLSRFNLCATAG